MTITNSKTDKEQALEMLQNTQKSKEEIAKELGISKQSVAAYEAHCTMGTYEGGKTTENKKYSLSRERDIEEKLAQNPSVLEENLSIKENGQQHNTSVGRIDLLAEDEQGFDVVIEIKKGKAKDSALGQVLGYIEEIEEKETEDVRGIIVAREFSKRVRKAAKRFPDLKLYSYEVNFNFEKTEVGEK